MDTDTETTTTAEMLAAMLTENTGRALCDSGGAYGRHWERNQGLTAETLAARPEVEVVIGHAYEPDPENPGRHRRTDGEVVDWITLDLFHFLCARCEYAPDLDAAFDAFCEAPEHRDETWFTCLSDFLDQRYGPASEARDLDRFVVNTYNGEDALSQTIQYEVVNDDDHGHVAWVSIHGGCDVRGGYTRPRPFLISDAYGLMDNDRYSVVVSSPDRERHVYLDHSGGYCSAEGSEWPWQGPDYGDGSPVFTFGTTPVGRSEDGGYVIDQPDSPFHGWGIDFYAPEPSY